MSRTNGQQDRRRQKDDEGNPFHWIPFLPGRRRREEETPLLNRDIEATMQNQEKSPIRRWELLKQSVREGTHLLTTPPQHDSPREQLKETIRGAMDFELWQCLLAILVYMLVGVIAFSFLFEHWSVEASIYYSLVTFTTIGYGDLTPQTAAGRIFTCFFALSGVAFLGIALGVLGNNLIEAEEKTLAQTKDLTKHRVLSLFYTPTSQSNTNTSQSSLRADDLPESTQDQSSSVLNRILWEFLFIMTILGLFALLVAADPGIGVGFNIGDALYYSLITATTIGYGDFAPTTKNGRLVAIIFIPLAVGAMGHFLSVVANAVMEAKQSGMRKKIARKDLSLADIEEMDADGDGNVTMAEYIEFMLIAMDKVDKDLMDELRDSFESLDKDGNGSINKHDLIEGARKKLQDPRRKLELHRYKQELLAKAKKGSHPNSGMHFLHIGHYESR